MAQTLSTNVFPTANFVVSSVKQYGTHTTIASALAQAVSGDIVFLTEGSYSESFTIPSGVCLVAHAGVGAARSVRIDGTISVTSGRVVISGISLESSITGIIINVSGASASAVILTNCRILCSGSNAITNSSSNAGTKITIRNCTGNMGSLGGAYFSSNSVGSVEIEYSDLNNTIQSVTANGINNGNLKINWSQIQNPISSSGTASIVSRHSTYSDLTNTTRVNYGGSGVNSSAFDSFFSGNAVCATVTSPSVLKIGSSVLNSFNSSAITGTGTTNYGLVQYYSSAQAIATTTKSAMNGRTWTPIVTFGGASVGITYQAQIGTYQRIGNLIYFNLYVNLTNKGTSVGNFAVSLPLPIASGSTPVPYSQNGITYFGQLLAMISGQTLTLQYMSSGGGLTPLTNAQFANSCGTAFTGVYRV